MTRNHQCVPRAILSIACPKIISFVIVRVYLYFVRLVLC